MVSCNVFLSFYIVSRIRLERLVTLIFRISMILFISLSPEKKLAKNISVYDIDFDCHIANVIS